MNNIFTVFDPCMKMLHIFCYWKFLLTMMIFTVKNPSTAYQEWRVLIVSDCGTKYKLDDRFKESF